MAIETRFSLFCRKSTACICVCDVANRWGQYILWCNVKELARTIKQQRGNCNGRRFFGFQLQLQGNRWEQKSRLRNMFSRRDLSSLLSQDVNQFNLSSNTHQWILCRFISNRNCNNISNNQLRIYHINNNRHHHSLQRKHRHIHSTSLYRTNHRLHTVKQWKLQVTLLNDDCSHLLVSSNPGGFVF